MNDADVTAADGRSDGALQNNHVIAHWKRQQVRVGVISEVDRLADLQCKLCYVGHF